MADIKDDELPVIDLAKTDGYVVDDSDEDDPSLIMPDGSAVQTWRENYPYEERMSREEYEVTKRALQIELLKWQNWTKETGQRHIILFEGRDAACLHRHQVLRPQRPASLRPANAWPTAPPAQRCWAGAQP